MTAGPERGRGEPELRTSTKSSRQLRLGESVGSVVYCRQAELFVESLHTVVVANSLEDVVETLQQVKPIG